jgi:hypothetical protein
MAQNNPASVLPSYCRELGPGAAVCHEGSVCGQAVTAARDLTSGVCYVFRNNCTPEGWEIIGTSDCNNPSPTKSQTEPSPSFCGGSQNCIPSVSPSPAITVVTDPICMPGAPNCPLGVSQPPPASSHTQTPITPPLGDTSTQQPTDFFTQIKGVLSELISVLQRFVAFLTGGQAPTQPQPAQPTPIVQPTTQAPTQPTPTTTTQQSPAATAYPTSGQACPIPPKCPAGQRLIYGDPPAGQCPVYACN